MPIKAVEIEVSPDLASKILRAWSPITPLCARRWEDEEKYEIYFDVRDGVSIDISVHPRDIGMSYFLRIGDFILVSYTSELDTKWGKSADLLKNEHVYILRRGVYLMGEPIEVSAHEAAIWISEL